MSGNDEIRMTNDELEQALAEMVPTAPDIDRDALMFQAGYAAARGLVTQRRTVRFWQGSTALMTAASVALAFSIWQRPFTEPTRQVVEVPSISPAPETIVATESPAADSLPAAQPAAVTAVDPLLMADPSKNYLALRAVVLQQGVEAWPLERASSPGKSPAVAPSRPSSVRGMMQELLPPPAERNRPANENHNEASTNREEPVV